MANAFWGGFAAGLSDSIEKNRDREALREYRQDRKDSRNAEKQHRLTKDTRRAFERINARIQKIKSGGTKLTDDEALNEVNRLQAQKLKIYQEAAEYGMKIGVRDPNDIIDINSEGIEQLKYITVRGQKYLINSELAETFRNSNGDLKFNGNEIMQRVKEPNSQGVLVPKRDGSGNFVWESTGRFLRKHSDVFRRPKGKGSSGQGVGSALKGSGAVDGYGFQHPVNEKESLLKDFSERRKGVHSLMYGKKKPTVATMKAATDATLTQYPEYKSLFPEGKTGGKDTRSSIKKEFDGLVKIFGEEKARAMIKSKYGNYDEEKETPVATETAKPNYTTEFYDNFLK